MLALVFCHLAAEASAQAPPPAELPPAASAAPMSPRGRAPETKGAVPTQSAPPAAAALSESTSNRAEQREAAGGAEESRDGIDTEAARPPAIEEVHPEVMYLRDQNGRLVPVPGFRYEDFLELLRIKQGLDRPAAKIPDYTLQQLLVSGRAEAEVARLTVRLDIQARKPDWVQVPLGLSGVSLVAPASYEGSGDYFLDYDETSRQYIAWLRGAAGGEHRLTLDVRAPLSITGARHTLALPLPRAATAKMELDVAGRDVVASATPPELRADVTGSENAWKIAVLGVGGDVALSWSESDKTGVFTEPVLESSGHILVQIDGRNVTSDAVLNVRSFGAPFERFHVQLPAGATLAGGQQSGYTVAPADAEGSSQVEVKLDKPTTGPVEVRLQSQRTIDLTRPETLELAGFQVIEAVAHRQAGQIAVVATGDWQVVWESRSRVRQIDEPVEELRRSDLLAAFEYAGQPCSLTARVVPRQARITVDPQYIYSVNAFQTDLEARLKCSVRGAKIFSLELDFAGWQVDEIGPASIVELSSTVTGEDARTRIPFVEPMIGEFEIVLRAHRSHASNPGDIELQLPIVKDAVVGPSTVAIIADDNVELTTKTAQLVSLSPQRVRPSLELPARRQEPLVFRGERAGAKYVAALTVHPQRISVQVATQASVGQTGIDVEQRFGYQVSYEPLERLTYAVPLSLGDEGHVQVMVNDEPVSTELISDHSAGSGVRMRVVLPRARMGLVEVVARFHVPLENLLPASTAPVDLPLMMPLDGEFAGNTLEIDCKTGFAVQPRGGNWKSAEGKQMATDSRLRLTAATAASSARLSIVVDERPLAGAASVNRAWIQTWLSATARQERAVFQITTQQPRVALTLPSGVIGADVEALLDAKPVLSTLRNSNTVVVEWPSDDEAHTLELRYPYLAAGAGMSVGLTTPEFGSSVRLRRMYWQLVLPRDQHVLASCSSLTPEFRRSFSALRWSRANLLDQAELEDWTRTLHEAPLPESANVYLFSIMGQEPALDVWIVRRSTIVFVASAIVLAVVLLALYLPRLRRPRTLLAVGALVCALAIAYPEPAIVLSQAALLGLALAIVAAVLHRLLSSDGRHSQQSQSSVLTGERSTTDAYYRPGPASGHSSTATRALALEQASSGSQVP